MQYVQVAMSVKERQAKRRLKIKSDGEAYQAYTEKDSEIIISVKIQSMDLIMTMIYLGRLQDVKTES